MIKLKNVSKTYSNGVEALKNVTLSIDRGEFVFIVGASGAGKSTFLKILLREEVPTYGSVIVNNFDLIKMKKNEIPLFRRTLGVVFQDFRLISKMSVYDNVAFAMRVIGANEKNIAQRVPYVLQQVGLPHKADSLPTQLSGGEQQRVALARALANNADLIIADEPTGNVDPEMSYEILELLDDLNKQGTTVVMVTHEHELIKKYDYRKIVIDSGCIRIDENDCAEKAFIHQKTALSVPYEKSDEKAKEQAQDDIIKISSTYYQTEELDFIYPMTQTTKQETIAPIAKEKIEKSENEVATLPEKKEIQTRKDELASDYLDIRNEIDELLKLDAYSFYTDNDEQPENTGGGHV